LYQNKFASAGQADLGSLMSALASRADICSAPTHVRFVPIADMSSALGDVRFVPIADWRTHNAFGPV